jgi:hypothetical protein
VWDFSQNKVNHVSTTNGFYKTKFYPLICGILGLTIFLIKWLSGKRLRFYGEKYELEFKQTAFYLPKHSSHGLVLGGATNE